MIKDEPNSENTIIIGNKPEFVQDQKTGEFIATEPYLRSILLRLSQFHYVYIKTMPFPEKLAKISQIYESLKYLGVNEIYGSRKFIYEKEWAKSNQTSNKEVKVMLIKWEFIPRIRMALDSYRKELLAEVKNEKND